MASRAHRSRDCCLRQVHARHGQRHPCRVGRRTTGVADPPQHARRFVRSPQPKEATAESGSRPRHHGAIAERSGRQHRRSQCRFRIEEPPIVCPRDAQPDGCHHADHSVWTDLARPLERLERFGRASAVKGQPAKQDSATRGVGRSSGRGEHPHRPCEHAAGRRVASHSGKRLAAVGGTAQQAGGPAGALRRPEFRGGDPLHDIGLRGFVNGHRGAAHWIGHVRAELRRGTGRGGRPPAVRHRTNRLARDRAADRRTPFRSSL